MGALVRWAGGRGDEGGGDVMGDGRRVRVKGKESGHAGVCWRVSGMVDVIGLLGCDDLPWRA